MKEKVLGGAALLGACAVLYFFAMPSYRQSEPSIAGRKAPLSVYGAPGVDQIVAGFNLVYALYDAYSTTPTETPAGAQKRTSRSQTCCIKLSLMLPQL